MRLLVRIVGSIGIGADTMRRRLPPWLPGVILLVMVVAGIRPAGAQRLAYRLYDADAGLTDGAITALAQDRAGFLYAGTENDLFRYDGWRFSQIGPAEGLPSVGAVDAVLAAPDGGTWAVFPDRVYQLGSGATVSAGLALHHDDTFSQRAAVLGEDLLLVRNGRLLRVHPVLRPGSGPGLSVRPYFAASAGSAASPEPRLDTVFVEHDRVWAGCGGQLCRVDPHGVTIVGAAASGLPADRWAALLRDRAGTLWLRSASRIASLPSGATRFSLFEVPDRGEDQDQGTPMLDLVEDDAGRVVTQGTHGLLVHGNGGWTARTFDPAFPLLRVDRMLTDREGSLWLGTNDGEGLVRLVGFALFDNWTRAEGLADNLIWDMSRDGGGTIWVAGEQGVDALPADERGGHGPAAPRHYPGRTLALATSAGGRLWIGEADGRLLRRDPRTGVTAQVAGLSQIFMMTQDPAGPLWVGTQDGLFRIDHPDDMALPTVSRIARIPERVFAMTFAANGDLWVLSEKTLFRRDRDDRWHAVRRIDPAGGYMTRSLAFAPDGSLWLGGLTTGLTRLRLDHGAVVGSDGSPTTHLASQDVEMLQADPAGRIWIGTDRGLDVTDGIHWRHLDREDGLVVDDFDENAARVDDDGTSWFGTSGGLSHLRDTRGLFRPDTLHPTITAIRLDSRKPAAPGDPPCQTHLRWSGDPLVISFAALDFRYEKSIRFRYRLRGFDQGWVETAAREARYTNPPFGRLVFEVVAIEPAHGLTSAARTVVIKMRPPWWKSPMAKAVGLALAVAALTLLWRLRVSFFLKRQRQLEAEVAARTGEIEAARLVLLKQATTDELTGLMNRAAIMERLRQAMATAATARTDLAVALLDLDHFKRINDSLGHLGGDAVLAEVGRRLADNTRGEDAAGRYGGEELLVVLPGLRIEARERVEQLHRATFAEPIAFNDDRIPMTGSMGVGWMQPGDDVAALVARADAALYSAKRAGRDRVAFDLPASRTAAPGHRSDRTPGVRAIAMAGVIPGPAALGAGDA